MSQPNIASLACFKDEQEYRKSNYISYSTLKDVEYNPDVLIHPEKREETEAMTLGSLVDVLMTDTDNFSDKFHVSTLVDYPSDVITKILRRSMNGTTKSIEDNVEAILDSAKYYGYGGSTWTDGRIFSAICKDGTSYYNELLRARNKTIISSDDYMVANNIKYLLTSHPWSKKYFISPKDSHIEIVYQFRFIFKACGVVCKSAIDILYINHSAKTIEPIDLKVGTNTFFNSYKKFRWDIQGVLYREGLTTFLDNYEEFSLYDVLPFKFLHVRTDLLNYPVLYEISDELHEQTLIGYQNIHGENITGVYELLDDVYYYQGKIYSEHADYLIPKTLEEHEGKVKLNKNTEFMPF